MKIAGWQNTARTPFLMYLSRPMLSFPNSTTSQLHGQPQKNFGHLQLGMRIMNMITQPHTPSTKTTHSAAHLVFWVAPQEADSQCGSLSPSTTTPHLTEYILHGGEIMPTKRTENTSWSSEILIVVLPRIHVKVQLRMHAECSTLVSYICLITRKSEGLTQHDQSIRTYNSFTTHHLKHSQRYGKNADVCYFHLFYGTQIVTYSWTDMATLTGTFCSLDHTFSKLKWIKTNKMH
jgi:hypothetical protein